MILEAVEVVAARFAEFGVVIVESVKIVSLPGVCLV
jgi:hypothetical protein